jgi:AcrR family transcriptional regulator
VIDSDGEGAEDADGEDEAAASEAPPDGRAARAERRRTERRRAILDAAQRVFRDKGYHQASVHDIIDEARIARGTFYLYFTSKQDVFAELVEEFLLVIRGQVRRIAIGPGEPPPFEQLRANFRRVVTTVLAHEDVATIILRDPTGFDTESGERVSHFFAQVLSMVEDALRVGEGLGLIRDCDKRIVAATSLGGLREALSRMLAAHGDDAQSRQRERTFADAEHLADELLQFVLRGLLR